MDHQPTLARLHYELIRGLIDTGAHRFTASPSEVAEAQRIFHSAGLRSPFWNLENKDGRF